MSKEKGLKGDQTDTFSFSYGRLLSLLLKRTSSSASLLDPSIDLKEIFCFGVSIYQESATITR